MTRRDRVASAHHASSARKCPRIPARLDGPVIIATGPLTSDALSADIAALVGGDHLYFYDAISPIVLAEIDRHVEGVPRVAVGAEPAGTCDARRRVSGPAISRRWPGAGCGVDDGEGDYLNCPFTADEYAALLRTR